MEEEGREREGGRQGSCTQYVQRDIGMCVMDTGT